MKPRGLHTDEDTISLLHRPAVHYPDGVIAGILNRQGRRTASGERFTANHVSSLRRYRQISRYEPPTEAPRGELVTIRNAAQILEFGEAATSGLSADHVARETRRAVADVRNERDPNSSGHRCCRADGQRREENTAVRC
jgi:hypothetical protein